jgi:hypothetical protein
MNGSDAVGVRGTVDFVRRPPAVNPFLFHKKFIFCGRRPKLRPHQQDEIVAMVSKGTKTAADAARLFNVHPATISRLLAQAHAEISTAKVLTSVARPRVRRRN